jgi:hypothetical protein
LVEQGWGYFGEKNLSAFRSTRAEGFPRTGRDAETSAADGHHGNPSRASVTRTLYMDNVVIDGVTTGAVPETSTWVMMVAGFAGLGFMGCRRAGASGA